MSLKVYFAGSIRGGREDAHLYAKIVKHLQDNVGRVLTEHVADANVIKSEESRNLTDKEIHDRDIEWLKECDVLVAEVTQPSLGVGYEIGRAVDLSKPILCLFRPASGKYLSAMISGAVNDSTFVVKNYNEDDVFSILDSYFKTFKK